MITSTPDGQCDRLRARLWLSLALLLAAAAPALAFEGRVISADTGEPVAGAEVVLLGHPGSVRTDGDGRFEWRPDPVPPFEILVILPGGRYMRPVLVDALPGDGPLVVRLSALLQESVTVTAGVSRGINTTPASGTTLLTAEEITVRQPVNLGQLLENVAGVSMTSEGQAAVPTVRGLARGRTLILIDGARVTTERRAGASATFLDPFTLESVEVSRGPGSVAYGSDAFGGLIAARTRRVAPGSPLRMRAEISLGTEPQGRGGLELSKGFTNGGVLAQAHYRSADDYRSPRGEVFNSGFSDRGFLVRGQHRLGRGVLTAGWQSDFGRDVDRPRTNSRSVRFFYPIEDSHRLTTSYELPQVGGWELAAVRGFFGRSRVVTDQDRLATATAVREIERADVSASDFEVRTSGERFLGRSKLEVGVDVNGRFDLTALDVNVLYDRTGAVATTRENISVDGAHRLDRALYASLDSSLLPRLGAGLGARIDRVTTRTPGGFFGERSTAHTAASGFASLSAGPIRGVTVTGQVASGFRDPTLSDRYFRGPTGRGFVTGSPELGPERSLQLDLAVRYTASRWRLAFYAYDYRIDDLVERFETDTDFFFFRNRGRARLRGAEVEAQAMLAGDVTLQLAALVMRGRALDDDSPLDDVPPPTVSAVLRKDFGRCAFGQLRGAAYARDDRPGPSEFAMPGYLLVDASGGYTFSERLQLRVLARNLLDRAYPVSPDRRAVLAPGLSLLTTAVVSF